MTKRPDLHAAVAHDPARRRSFVEAGWWRGETLAGWLDRRVASTPDGIAIVSPEATLDYRELKDRSDRLAGALLDLGIGPGDVVGVQLLNRPEYLIAHSALARIGAVLTTIHASYRPAEMEVLLAHGGARAIICEDRIRDHGAAEVALELHGRIPSLEHVIVLGERVPGTHDLTRMIETGSAIDLGSGPEPTDPFLLLYTSGTSDRPKAVAHNFEAMLSNARLSAPEFGVTENDVILAAGPYSHLYALLGVHMAFWTGAANLLLASYSPPALVDTIARFRPSVMLAVPAHMAACLKDGLFDARDMSSLRLVIVAGSAVPPDLIRELDRKLPNGTVAQLWGMTEMQAGTYTRPGDDVELAATTAGRPAPGVEVRLLDDDGSPVAAGELGELQVRGSSVFTRYYGNDEANAEAFTADGWFRTGDVAVADEAGNITISGRIKDIINRGGVKYNPREIEDLLHRHPAIAEAAIVPVPDPVLGEKACCCIVRAGDGALDLAGLCDYLAGHGIAKHKLPERLEFFETLPRGPTRKVVKDHLVEQLSG